MRNQTTYKYKTLRAVDLESRIFGLAPTAFASGTGTSYLSINGDVASTTYQIDISSTIPVSDGGVSHLVGFNILFGNTSPAAGTSITAYVYKLDKSDAGAPTATAQTLDTSALASTVVTATASRQEYELTTPVEVEDGDGLVLVFTHAAASTVVALYDVVVIYDEVIET
jgi:hypothetical protein